MIIEVKASDTLFFRDGKPFSADEDTWAETVFPPFPSVFYGALRTAYFSENPQHFKNRTGNGDPTKSLSINNYYLKLNPIEQYYLPLPADCLKNTKYEDEKVVEKLKLEKIDKDNVYCNYPLEYLLVSTKVEVEEIDAGYLDKQNFINYLNDDFRTLVNFETLESFITPEPKIGIATSKITKSSEKGHLYRTNLVRPCGKKTFGLNQSSFIIEFSGLELPENGFLRLGGEGKVASYKTLDFQDNTSLVNIPFPEFKNDDEIFKIVFTTPCIFKNRNKTSWLPSWIDYNTLKGTVPLTSIGVKLVAASFSRPYYRGGFDMYNKTPKNAYKVIPPGSVFYFKLLDRTNDLNELKNIHGIPISDESRELGLGVSYIGRCSD